MNLGIIQKETPYGEKASRKSVYSIEDNMFRFWHRFVLENNSIIARGTTDLVYNRIEPKLSDYIGKVFEDICKQYQRFSTITLSLVYSYINRLNFVFFGICISF